MLPYFNVPFEGQTRQILLYYGISPPHPWNIKPPNLHDILTPLPCLLNFVLLSKAYMEYCPLPWFIEPLNYGIMNPKEVQFSMMGFKIL
jgi:hypothetical protein